MNPILGVFFHWLGGLAAGSFYVPFRGVKRWSWEIYWITGGVFSWVVSPWIFASLQTNDLTGVLGSAPTSAIVWPIFFGAMWGFGGLTYGLTMRYLGLSLGMAVVLGLCTVFGTLIPPLFAGELVSKLFGTMSGRYIMLGILITVLGIVVVAMAGARKDEALSAEQKKAAVEEFNFRKGVWIAIFSGVMSSCFAYGLAAGEPIKPLSIAAGTNPLWAGLPILCLVMFGGLITNAVWCTILIVRNKSAGQWFASDRPRLRNFLLSAAAGTIWYFQFFFYTAGESQMGRFGFSSWTIHMASIIIFGTLWGFAFREWKDAAPRVRAMVWSGVALLVLATLVIGYGNSLAAA
jgi:L-rhamnose-H+ transport protein